MGDSDIRVKKEPNIGVILILLAAVFAVIGLAVMNSIYKKQFVTYVDSMNSGAANTFKVFKVSDEFEKLLIDAEEGGDYFIYGERSDDGSYVAYQRGFITKNTLIFGEPYREASSYWAARVVNKNVTEVWTSETPLDKEMLQKYTYDEQVRNYRFLHKFSESGVVGYYSTVNAV